MQWIDSHCHSTLILDKSERTALLRMLQIQGCVGLVQGGIDPEEWDRQLELSNAPIPMARVFGLHPWALTSRTPDAIQAALSKLEHILCHADALGELGLDWAIAKTHEQRQVQKQVFAQQLELARLHRKPIVLHCVRAYSETWAILKSLPQQPEGLLHGFWTQRQNARPFIEAGYVFSLPPRIQHGDPHQLLSYLPREQIVFESDAPQKRLDGSWTTPLQALHSLQHAAQQWGEDPALTCDRQLRTLQRLFAGLMRPETS